MKKIFRFVGLGGLLTAMLAVGAVASFAQDACTDVDGINNLYNDVLANYKGPETDKIQKAVDSAKQFLEKYGSCETAKAQVDWMKPKVPGWEDRIKVLDRQNKLNALYKRFNDGTKAKNYDEVYASGKEILNMEPDNLDAILILGSIGLDESGKKNYKYNEDTLKYAKLAIDKVNSGATSKTFGTLGYAYNTKENALGWMNYTIGYILFNAKDDKKGALPYIYKASLTGPETSVNPVVYETIGKYFLGETIRLRDESKAKIQAQVATDPDDVKAKKEAEVKELIALLKGNAERALDAYSRAYKVAKTDAATKAYRDSLYQTIQQLYNVRFEKTDGLDVYVASAAQKPLLDPATPVTPVQEEVKTDTTTTTSVTPAASPTPTKPAVTKPSETSGVTKSATAKESVAPAKPGTVAAKKANQ